MSGVPKVDGRLVVSANRCVVTSRGIMRHVPDCVAADEISNEGYLFVVCYVDGCYVVKSIFGAAEKTIIVTDVPVVRIRVKPYVLFMLMADGVSHFYRVGNSITFLESREDISDIRINSLISSDNKVVYCGNKVGTLTTSYCTDSGVYSLGKDVLYDSDVLFSHHSHVTQIRAIVIDSSNLIVFCLSDDKLTYYQVDADKFEILKTFELEGSWSDVPVCIKGIYYAVSTNVLRDLRPFFKEYENLYRDSGKVLGRFFFPDTFISSSTDVLDLHSMTDIHCLNSGILGYYDGLELLNFSMPIKNSSKRI